jgi:hypothetical protein
MYGPWVIQNVYSVFWVMVLSKSNRLLPTVVEKLAVSISTSRLIMDVTVPVKTEIVSLRYPGLVHSVVR